MAFNVRIQHKRDTASNWEINDPVLLDGELIIVDTNTGDVRFKIGNGAEPYTQLPFQDEALYNVLSSKATESYVDSAIEALVIEIEKKQNALTFDATPTADSTNPVTSGGIKSYVDSSFIYATESDIESLF